MIREFDKPIIECFEGVAIINVIAVNHSETIVIIPWHQELPADLFDKLIRLSIVHHLVVQFFNEGDQVTFNFEEAD